MAHAMEPATADPLFKTHAKMTVQKGAYVYTIELRGQQPTYSVTDGAETVTVPIRWVFGANAQTYVLERNGQFYESLVSYWKNIDALDATVGDQAVHPTNVNEALGRPLASSEITACFGCHSTGSVSQHHLTLNTITYGVTCAHCHLAAGKHLESISHGNMAVIPAKLKTLSPEEISSFCGQCHRTWETVVRNHWLGPMDVRFQPYRLEISKCFDGKDPRISCIACHDPHKEVVRDEKTYDANCLSCHTSGSKLSFGMVAFYPNAKTMKTCPVAKENCVSCHMPKVDLPGSPHQAFFDHDIRIVRPGDSYPH